MCREREEGVQLDHQSRASDKRKRDEGNHGTILKEKKISLTFLLLSKKNHSLNVLSLLSKEKKCWTKYS